MYCRFCGTEIPEDSAFCPNCGKKVLKKEELPLSFINDNYELFIYVISCFFTFSKEQLEKFQDKLFWGYIIERDYSYSEEYIYDFFNDKGVRLVHGVGSNQNIIWSTEMFEEFKKLNKTIFMAGSNLILRTIISKYADNKGFIRWKDLILNDNLIWDYDLINTSLKHLKWYDLIDIKNIDLLFILSKLTKKKDFEEISGRIKIKDNLQIIERFEAQWDWNQISGNHDIYWTDEYLEKYESKLDWYRLQNNPNIRWTLNSIIKFKKKIRVYSDGGYMQIAYDGPGSSYPTTAEYNFGIDRFVDNELALILLKELFNPKLFSDTNRYYDYKQNLCGFSLNQKINWSLELLQKYKDNWNWRFLSKNESINFNEKIIENFESKWDWRELCCNKGVKWDSHLIEKYKNGTKSLIKLSNVEYEFLILGTRYQQNMFDEYSTLIKGLDSNPSVRFDELLVNKYFDKWNWYYLLNNESVHWTKNLLLRVINSTELYYNLEMDEEGKFFKWIEIEPEDDLYKECTHFYSRTVNHMLEIKQIEPDSVFEGEARLIKDYNVEKELYYEKLGYKFIRSIWELIFKDFVDVYGIDRLLNLNKIP